MELSQKHNKLSFLYAAGFTAILIIIAIQAIVIYDNYYLFHQLQQQQVVAITEKAYAEESEIRKRKLYPDIKTETSYLYQHYILNDNNEENDIKTFTFRMLRAMSFLEPDTAYIDSMHIEENIIYHSPDSFPGDRFSKNVNPVFYEEISEKLPVNLSTLDSIIRTNYRSYNLSPEVYLFIAETESGIIKQEYGKKITEGPFVFPSKLLPINARYSEFIQVNIKSSFSDLFNRMGISVFLSFLLATGCLYVLIIFRGTIARQKNAIEAKDDFFDHISHEIKRPLVNMQMVLNGLNSEAVNNNQEKRMKYLSIAGEATKNMQSKIDMILSLSKAENAMLELEKEQTDISSILCELKDHFTTLKKENVFIELHTECSENNILIDKHHITHVFSNLLDNAIKYSGQPAKIRITLTREKDWFVITISDEGYGIPNTGQDKIFEKYTRILPPQKQQIEGYGIGLYYVKEIIKKHHGQIRLESEIGKGSKFIVYLPVS